MLCLRNITNPGYLAGDEPIPYIDFYICQESTIRGFLGFNGVIHSLIHYYGLEDIEVSARFPGSSLYAVTLRDYAYMRQSGYINHSTINELRYF